MTLMRFDPVRDFDRLTEQLFGPGRAPSTVPMEAFRRGDEVVVALDLPATEPDDVDVTVERNVVSVHATRRPERQEGDEVFVDERPKGEFTRQLFLGDNLDTSRLSAGFDRGVLTLRIPVTEESKPRRVEIEAARQGRRTIEADRGEPS